MISIIKEASRVNLAQADLIINLKELGSTAEEIMKIVPSIAKLMI